MTKLVKVAHSERVLKAQMAMSSLDMAALERIREGGFFRITLKDLLEPAENELCVGFHSLAYPRVAILAQVASRSSTNGLHDDPPEEWVTFFRSGVTAFLQNHLDILQEIDRTAGEDLPVRAAWREKAEHARRATLSVLLMGAGVHGDVQSVRDIHKSLAHEGGFGYLEDPVFWSRRVVGRVEGSDPIRASHPVHLALVLGRSEVLQAFLEGGWDPLKPTHYRSPIRANADGSETVVQSAIELATPSKRFLGSRVRGDAVSYSIEVMQILLDPLLENCRRNDGDARPGCESPAQTRHALTRWGNTCLEDMEVWNEPSSLDKEFFDLALERGVFSIDPNTFYSHAMRHACMRGIEHFEGATGGVDWSAYTPSNNPLQAITSVSNWFGEANHAQEAEPLIIHCMNECVKAGRGDLLGSVTGYKVDSTVLMCLVAIGLKRAVFTAMDLGADPLENNNKGENALDFARRMGKFEIEDVILTHLARQQALGALDEMLATIGSHYGFNP